MFPEYWKTFIHNNNLDKAMCLIVNGNDNNYLYLLPEQKAIEEAKDLFPGKEVYDSGYIPVAICEEGTGDIYCINHSEGECGALYLVLLNEDEDNQKISKVFKNYEMLLPFVCRQ